MDIRNLIRIQAQVDMAQMTAGARHLDRYTAAIDRHNVAMRRLQQSSGAERVLQGIARAAVAASNQTQAALIRMRGGIQAALARLSTLSGPARAGFSSIVAAAEGAARRTAAAFQRLRIALPRSGIAAFERTLGQLPALARTAVSRTNAALTRLHLAAFRALDPFAGLPAFARRAVASTNAILASLRLPRFLTGDPFQGLVSSAQRTARSVQDAFARLRTIRLPTLSLPRLGLEGLQRTLGTLPTIARAAVTRTNAALSGLRITLPRIGIEAWQRGFTAINGTLQATVGRVATFGRSLLGLNRQISHGNVLVEGWGLVHAGAAAQLARHNVAVSRNATLTQRLAAIYRTVGQAGTSMGHAVSQAGAAMGRGIQAGAAIAQRGLAALVNSLIRLQLAPLTTARAFAQLQSRIITLDAAFAHLAARGGPIGRAFATLGSAVNGVARSLTTTVLQIRNYGVATAAAVATTNLLRTSMLGLAAAASAVAHNAANAARGLVSGLSGGAIGGPPAGGGAAAAGAAAGWGAVGRAAALAGGAMRQAGILGVRSLQAIAGAAASTVGALSGLVANLSLAFGTIGFLAVATGARFEQALSKITALTNVVAENFGGNLGRATAGLTEEILKLTRVIPRTPEELGAGLYFILSAGIRDVSEAYKILRVSAEAAVAGQTSVQVVADAVTSALLAYHLGADSARGITDALTQAVIEGKTEFDTFAASIGRVLPAAANIGVTFEEVAASLAVLTRVGLNSEEAATAIRAAFLNLTAAAPETKEALASIGLSIGDIQKAIKERGFLAVANELYNAFGGNIEQLDKIIPNIRALTGFLVLGGSGAQVAAEAYERVRHATDGAGRTSESFATAMTTLINKLGLLRNSLIEIGVMIFAHFEKPLKGAIDGLTRFFTSIADWMRVNQEATASIVRMSGALTALALVAFGLPKILQAASLFFGLFGAFGLTTVRARQSFAGLGTVLKVIAPLFVLIAAAAIGLGKAFDINLGAGIDRIRRSFGRLGDDIGPVLSGIKDLFSGVISVLSTPLGRASGVQEGTERVITPLQRLGLFMERWREDQKTSWFLFRQDLRSITGGIGQAFGHVADQVAPILDTVTQIVRGLAPSVLPALGAFASSAIEAGAHFIDGLVRGFIAALPALEQIRAGLFDWIAETAPVIADRLEQWSASFLGWVAEVGPGLVSGMASWVGDGLARILGLLADWLPAIARWAVTDFIPGVFTALRGLVDGLINALTEGRIIQRLTASLVEGIITLTPQLIAGLAVVLAQLAAFLVTEGPRLAFVLVRGFVEGFLEGIRRVFDDLASPIRELGTVITFALVPAFLRLTTVMAATATRGALLLIAPLLTLTQVTLALAAAIAGRVIQSFSTWRAEMMRLGIVSGSLSFATMLGGLRGIFRPAQQATQAMTALQTATHLEALAAQRATGSLLAAGTAATVASGGFGTATGRIGRFAGRLGLGGVISGLGRLASFLPAVGSAVLAFTILYETNFLGLRDVTDDVVGWIIDRLGDLGDSFVDILRDLHLLDDWAASQGGTRTEIDALGQSYRDLQQAMMDLTGATSGGDVGAGVWSGTTLPDVTALIGKITELGDSYGVAGTKAVDAFLRIARAMPRAGEATWLTELERTFQGLPTTFDAAAARMQALVSVARAASFEGRDYGLKVRQLADDTEEELDRAADAWESYRDRTQAAIDDARDSVIGMSDPLQAALRDVQQTLGEGFKLPELDLTGLMRPAAIARLKAALALIPQATTDMTAAQVAALEGLRTETQRQLTILTEGLDTLALKYGVNVDELFTVWEKLGDLPNPTAVLEAALKAGKWPPTIPAPTLPDPEQVLLDWAAQFSSASNVSVLAAKWKTQVARFGEELGFGEGIKVPVAFSLPDAAMPPIDVSGIGTGAGKQIAADLRATAPQMGLAAGALATQIRRMLAIQSEPEAANSPLRGITGWGMNMARTIATGLGAGRALIALAVKGLAGVVAMPFLQLLPSAFAWGLATGLSYAAGLRAARAQVAAAAAAVAFSVVKMLKASSPPGTDSPLHHIVDWGRATMEAFADGISAARGRVLEATRSVVDVAASTLSKSRLPELNIGASGVFTATSALTPMRLAAGGSSGAQLGPDPAVPELLSVLINEQRLNNQLLARVAANDPNASGALPARGTLDQLRFIQRRS